MSGNQDCGGPQLLTVEVLSAASRLSVSTIHRLKRQGRIPFVQPAGKGGRVLFPADAIARGAVSTHVERLACDPSRGQLSGPRTAWMQHMSSKTQDT